MGDFHLFHDAHATFSKSYAMAGQLTAALEMPATLKAVRLM